MFKPSSGARNDNKLKIRRNRDRIFAENRDRRGIAQFNMEFFDINNFGRNRPRPRDCVINAMEMLGLFDKFSADLMRIMVGETGLQEYQLTECFNLMYQDLGVKFHLHNFSNPKSLGDFITNSLNLNHVIFCGYDSKHVFLIGKGLDGNLYLIDPQLGLSNHMCNLSFKECLDFIDHKGTYHVLKYYNKN